MTPQERIAAIRERLERGDYPQPVIIDADAYPDLAWCADYIDHLLGIAEAAEKMREAADNLSTAVLQHSEDSRVYCGACHSLSRDVTTALSAYDAALKVKP